MRVAVLGLGEAGSIYAADLSARGASVRGTDLRVTTAPVGVDRVASVALAVRGADVVLSLVGASSADSVLDEALPAMERASVFVDMNTSGSDDKKRLATIAADRRILFVDAAIMAPVTRARVETPLLLSGSGVAALAPILTGLRIPVTDVGAEAGAAARLKLLRSVFMKGLAAVIVESVSAARAFGAEGWLVDQMIDELGASDRSVIEHFIEGTTRHAVRREREMIDARDLLVALETPHPMTDGTIEWLRMLAAQTESLQNR